MFRFTIRDVLLLTALAAASVAWGVDRARLSRRARYLESQVQPPIVSPPFGGFGGWSQSGSTE